MRSAPALQWRDRSAAIDHCYRKRFVSLALLATAIFATVHLSSFTAARARAQTELSSEPGYLNPLALKFSPDGRRLYVVCEGSDSLLAVDVAARQVTARAAVGIHPQGLALSPDGKTLYVANEGSDTVSEIDAASFQPRRMFRTGWGPVGLTTDRPGNTLYVANSIGNDISLIDLVSGEEIKRLGAWRSPHQVALSRDGRRVYVSNLLAHLGPYDQPPVSELTAIDAERQSVAERIPIPGVIELGHIAEAPRRDGGELFVPFVRPKNLGPLVRVEQGWVVTHGMAIVRPAGAGGPGSEETSVTEVLLDDIDYFFAGNHGAAITPDGRLALVAASGASVVSVVDADKLRKRLSRFPAGDLADRLDSAREFVVRRLPTDQDPRDIAVSPDGRQAFVANRLADSLTVLDLAELKVAGSVDLGGPRVITPRRRGERLFHDASYCYQGQFACATCHPSDHVDGLAWNLETPRLGRDRVDNRTLRGIAETAPYKWNGHNPDLITQCGPRIARFLFRSEGFSTEELQNLVAFLRTIPLPRNRHLARDGALTEAQTRGQRLFFRATTNDGQVIPVQNRCDTCHPPQTHYTNRLSADVGSGTDYDTLTLFDVPQLDRVYESAPYLHNGEAQTLEEIWTVYNNQNTHGYTSDLRKEQLNDLIEYLKTL